MPEPNLRAIRAAVEELEAVAFLLRSTAATSQAGVTVVGPGIARVLEGTAARLLESLPQDHPRGR